MPAPPRSSTMKQETTRLSDVHIEGCLFEWHEERGIGTTHINAYSHAVNLARAQMGQIFASSNLFRAAWDEDRNVLFRAWEKGERPGTLMRPRSRFRLVKSYDSRTAALTGREPTGIMVSRGAERLRSGFTAPSRMTAMSPEARFRTRAY